MIRNWFARLAVTLVLLSTISLAHAQDSSSMTGVVTDATGAIVPGTTVTLTNPQTGTSFTATTDSNGAYRFANVPPQKGYIVTFNHSGFSAYAVKDLSLQVGITRTQDAKLQPGTSQEVEVSASNQVVTLNTTDASIGNNFDVKMLNELPIQDRSNVSALFALQPGVANGSVTGARTDQSNVTLDGMDSNDISTGQAFTISTFAPPDAIQEFRGVVGGQDASLGSGGGGQFQLVTKSGTNRFHGNVNEYHRDPSTVANTWFNKNATVPLVKPKVVQNQFGGNIGGPIILPKLFNGHDRAFFFFDFNNGRIASTGQTSRTVPLDSFRNGVIGYTNNGTGCNTASRRSNAPQCITDLTAAQIAAFDPIHAGENSTLFSYINSRYPHANDLTLGDGINTGGYRFSQATGSNLYNYVGRVDVNLTSKQKVFIRGIAARRDGIQSFNQFDIDPVTYPQINRSYGFVASHIWQLSNTKVNQFYYGDTITVLKFPVNYSPTGITSFTFGPLSAPNGSLSAQGRRVPIPEIRDDFNWTVGHHTIQIGGTFKFIKSHSYLTNDYVFAGIGLGGLTAGLNSTLRPANINSSATLIGRYDSAFAFSLGRVASLSRNYNYDAAGNALAPGAGSQRAYRSYQTEFYIGDTWKASSSLTLDYGVHYSIYSTPYEVNGRQTNQNLGFDEYFAARVAQSNSSISGNSAVPFFTYSLGGKANNADAAFATSYKDVAPRFGFAFNPESARNTVLNGSFNMVYDRTVYQALNFVQDQLSYLFQNTQATSYGATDATVALTTDPRLGANLSYPTPPAGVAIDRSKPFTPYVTNGVPNGIVAGQSNYAIDKNFKTPYSLIFNLGVQQRIKGGLIVNGSYVGRLGRRLIGQADASQLLDFPDKASGQLMSTAFANLSRQVRADPTLCTAANAGKITTQPWFENNVTTTTGLPSKTAVLAYYNCSLTQIGDFADNIQFLQGNGILGKNIGLPGQFGANTLITNKGWSSYHGALLTVTKNPTHGLQAQFNYTFSHSTDNVSAIANTIGISTGLGQVCDATDTRRCYGNSDFDVKHVINSNFVYELPFGRGRTFGSGMNRYADLLVGGWSISGIPGWRSGLTYGTTTGAYLAGYANNAPAIFTGTQAQLKHNLHKNSSNQLVMYDDAVANNPNSFGAGATSVFRNPAGFEYGSRNNLRGPSAFTFDAGVAKRFQIIQDRVTFQLRGDFFNVLNHPVFSTPAVVNINSAPFGQITSTVAVTGNQGARIGQISGRIEF